jgi:hypothetical protein
MGLYYKFVSTYMHMHVYTECNITDLNVHFTSVLDQLEMYTS